MSVPILMMNRSRNLISQITPFRRQFQSTSSGYRCCSMGDLIYTINWRRHFFEIESILTQQRSVIAQEYAARYKWNNKRNATWTFFNSELTKIRYFKYIASFSSVMNVSELERWFSDFCSTLIPIRCTSKWKTEQEQECDDRILFSPTIWTKWNFECNPWSSLEL